MINISSAVQYLRWYLANLMKATMAFGIALDEEENAVTGGAADQTISIRDALMNKAGRLWGHISCFFLAVFVEWNHCQNQLAGKPMSKLAYIRALIALVAVPWLIIWLIFRAA